MAVVLAVVVLAVPTVSSVDAETGFTTYYDQLDSNGQMVYNALESMDPDTLTVEITLPHPIYTSGESAEAYLYQQLESITQLAWQATHYDDPMAFWTWNMSQATYDLDYELVHVSDLVGVETFTFKAVLSPGYRDDPTTPVNELQVKVDALKEFVDTFTVKSTDPDDIVCEINDYLTDTSNIIYDPYASDSEKVSPYCHDAYGALIALSEYDGEEYHFAVCDGYSSAFKLLCDKFGIDCAFIVGTSDQGNGSENHAWNAVKLEEEWYAMDVTWNATSSDAYLLVGQLTKDSSGMTFLQTHSPGVMEWGYATETFLTPVIADYKYYADPTPSFFDEYGEDIALIGVAAVLIIALFLMARGRM